MARTLMLKELIDTRLANTYGGWIYCDNCGKNIGYLCYVTYDNFKFDYVCECGNHGSMHLEFKDTSSAEPSDEPLKTIKNRLCCNKDDSPLFTVLSNKLKSYRYEVVCSDCGTKYVAKSEDLSGDKTT